MSEIINIESISQFHKVMGYPKPTHPLISLVDLSKAELETTTQKKVSCSLYAISLKTKYTSKPVQYGKNYFDFEEGVLIGMSPGQTFFINKTIAKGDMEGWALYFHPDLILNRYILLRRPSI